LVCDGAGAAGSACLELLKAIGFTPDNIILCDTKGVVYQGRREGMNQWKSAHAAKTSARTLAEALAGADVFFGLSVAGAVTKAMVKSMASKPIIFAMANPDPEITVEDVAEVRTDAIMATGRRRAERRRAAAHAPRCRRRRAAEHVRTIGGPTRPGGVCRGRGRPGHPRRGELCSSSAGRRAAGRPRRPCAGKRSNSRHR